MANFEQDGVVSIWAFLEEENPADADKDVLVEFCGVDDYDVDFQEGDSNREGKQPLASLLSQLSYSQSFIDAAVAAAKKKGIK